MLYTLYTCIHTHVEKREGCMEADGMQPIVDLGRDPESEQPEQVAVTRDGPSDKRLKGLVTRVRMNISVDEEIAAFLQSMKVTPQNTTKEHGYSGFLEERVRASEAFQRWREERKRMP